MNYFISFLEGIITFISPCLLPMLPIYISYFSGQKSDGRKNVVKNSLGFVLGFTFIFVLLGAFAGGIGNLLREYNTIVNIVSGIIMVVLGLNFIGVIGIPFLNKNLQFGLKYNNLGFMSSVIFGIAFSISWTPCIGTFLGSALMLAASAGGSIQGILLLLCFSLGLGIPFIISAVLIDRLKSTFDFIKNHFHTVKLISGGVLIIVGILMSTGLMGYFLALLSF